MNNYRFEDVLYFSNDGAITYIMSDSFRIHYNHGLTRAIEIAESKNQKLQIILLRTPEENERNNKFFLEGIKGFQGFLSKFTNEVYYFEELTEFFYTLLEKSSLVIKDRAYLKEHIILEEAIKQFLKTSRISFTLVESNVLVPVLYASNKEEYSARTIRPKIMRSIDSFTDFVDFKSPTFLFEQEAKEQLFYFIENKLSNYDKRNDPSSSYTSELSPYLKYGFISPLEIYNQIHNSGIVNADLFVEELIVRRELAFNFVFYNKNYNDFKHITYNWVYQSIEDHFYDKRPIIYTKEDYINFRTHDIYFNTAMKEMVHLGKMHGYMRMYWAKKIMEWSESLEEAYHIIISLNNYYFLDGNTPNGYTGVAWSFGKHDRAWADRPIFGKIRYMNQKGLLRKFDMEKYVSKINKLIK